MKEYDRYIEIAVRVLAHIRQSEGLEAAMTAACAMIDAATAISHHEFQKSCQKHFPSGQFPEGGPYQHFQWANGERITVYREPITSQHFPPAA